MKQTKIDQFFKQPNQKLPATLEKKPNVELSAQELLSPLFVRQIPDADKYKKQLQDEFELIDKNSFAPVFLQVKTIFDLIDEIGKETGKIIPHIIRGSAGSSLVCYLLGITHIDPLLHGIQLARFMNKGRTDIPDIDIDVPYNRREEIYTRISEKWSGMVARISNHVKYSHKVALREVIRDTLELEKMPLSLRKKDYDIRKFLPSSEDQKKAKEEAQKKVGTHKNFSKHCGGIVIFEEQGKVPEDLILQTLDNNIQQIKLDKDETEDSGFIKIDILSNRGLAQIADICPNLPFSKYPVRDYGTERIFEKGNTIGITFGESRGMRKLFMEMKPLCIRDIAVALALIRPAAAAEGRKQEFLTKWKRNPNEAQDPILRPIIFDDDAICKIKNVLECSTAEADKWRKYFAKGTMKNHVEFRQKMYEKGYDRTTADCVVDDLNQLVYYSFCKSHAISYAQLVWALAYWKSHSPHLFWVATLNHCNSEYRKWVHYREAKCSGLVLTTNPPPYTLGKRNNEPALVSKASEQSLLHPKTAIQEFSEYGYWTSEEFLPTCGLWKSGQKRLDDEKQFVSFRGLIACGRTVTRDWGVCTLLCLGIANKEYIDLVIPNVSRKDLFRFTVLDGKGLLSKRNGIETIEVKSIRGISLKSLQNKK